MQRQHLSKPVIKQSKLPKLITLGLVLIIIIFAVSLLPRGFSGDTSVIGKGIPVLVLVHDDNILQSGETMVVMNQIRNEYAARLEFVVADINTPEGRAFANSSGFMPTALIFYSSTGQNLRVIYSPQTAESLRQALEVIF
ncbi:MAG: hypothetical protein KDF59_10100 [Nitrosomonas sp.]|nr:hypothetical protein [Nitrosomonas sp.]